MTCGIQGWLELLDYDDITWRRAAKNSFFGSLDACPLLIDPTTPSNPGFGPRESSGSACHHIRRVYKYPVRAHGGMKGP